MIRIMVASEILSGVKRYEYDNVIFLLCTDWDRKKEKENELKLKC